jgi:4-diphosphocytidyl-2-C-methyl-D-erythritol kinase
MVTIGLCDLVTLTPGDSGLRATGPYAVVPEGENNLASRALAGLQRLSGATARHGIALHKQIPSGAGLGGGSGNAAAVLRAAGRLGADVPAAALAELAFELGADVPYQLSGGPALVMGAGEDVWQLRQRTLHLAVCWPRMHASTTDVFHALEPADLSPGQAIEAAVTEWNRPAEDTEFLMDLPNGLLPAALRRYPELVAARAALQHVGWSPRLTGSGAAWFEVCPNHESALSLVAAASTLGWPAWACHTLPPSLLAPHT